MLVQLRETYQFEAWQVVECSCSTDLVSIPFWVWKACLRGQIREVPGKTCFIVKETVSKLPLEVTVHAGDWLLFNKSSGGIVTCKNEDFKLRYATAQKGETPDAGQSPNQ